MDMNVHGRLVATPTVSPQAALPWLPLVDDFDRFYFRGDHGFVTGLPLFTPPPSYHDQTSQRINNETKWNEIHTTTVNPYHLAYPRNYHFIMDHTEVCKAKAPFLVLMVAVATSDTSARDAIRRTWGNETLVQGELVKTLFLLGLPGGDDAEQKQQKLRAENLLYNDLIQSNFMDTYLNLTIKTMVIMDWLATHCPGAAYAMKIDADMFLNVDNLVIMLKKPGIPKQNYLTGMLMRNRDVVRFKDSKWYVSEELFPDPVYPTYALGMGYVFSNDLTEKFVQASKAIKPFNIEDAYIGMCMKNLGLAPMSPPDPSQFKAYNTRYNRCEFSQVITYILGSSQQLVKYWTDFKKPGSPC
uniref:Hexosyltransferase n=1 Tax=Myripristis murdjan TaxID=586833 RepID=A0A667ZJN1_9TELE